MKKSLMKLLAVMSVILLMIFGLAACGGGSEAPAEEPAEVEEEVAEEAEEPRDVLAGTTYVLTSNELEESKDEFQNMEVSGDQIPKFVFGENGEYEETRYEPDIESGDFETLHEKKVTGTYTVDGNTLNLQPNTDKEETAGTGEADESSKPTLTIEGDTIVIQIPYQEKEDGSVVVGFRSTFTKEQ